MCISFSFLEFLPLLRAKGRRTQGTEKEIEKPHISKQNPLKGSESKEGKGEKAMKKSDMLNNMREEAITALNVIYPKHLVNDGGATTMDNLRCHAALLALRSVVCRTFGFFSEEYKEFNYYLENYDKPFPQPQS